MTKKEYAEIIEKLIKSLTKMHGREFYMEYASNEDDYDKIKEVLEQMKNEID